MPKKKDKIKCHNLYSAIGVKGKNAINIKKVATIPESDVMKVNDTMLERFYIKDGNIEDLAATFVCAHLDDFLMKTKKIPMLYTIVTHITTVTKIELFTFHLYFHIEDQIETKDKFLTKDIYGSFEMELSIGNSTTVLESGIEKFPGSQEMIEKMREFVKSEEMISMLPELIKTGTVKHQERMNKEHGYKFEYTEDEMPKASIGNDIDLSSMSREELRAYVANKIV
jgi:hypothetical protein